MGPTLEQLHADEVLEGDDVPGERALRDVQRTGCAGETAVARDAFERPQGVQGEPAAVDADFFDHDGLPRNGLAGPDPGWAQDRAMHTHGPASVAHSRQIRQCFFCCPVNAFFR